MKTALLFLFAVLFTATSCSSRTNPCVCLKTLNVNLPPSRVKSYYLQEEGLCHITAVVITTMKGLTVCADPKKHWVIKAMKLVDGRKMAYTTTARPMSTASERTVNTQENSSSSCCLKKKKSVKNHHKKKIVDCKVQSGDLCPFEAIIIRTHKGRQLCLDPQEEWVLKNVVMNGTNTCDVTLTTKNTRNEKRAGKRRVGKKRNVEQEKGSLD
ncbi:uncharacterized protein LOC124375659 [Silurus meridionalis]|uniref:Chemokine interleukin-8-like domain-containing protein n=1 Tax=Silurus meridionalis TaxID=175797 RepID=A0A8T0AJJ2_SILME|nr:uncharacterized protein LOC124375659 [Silurus meridionalis]KAF7691791.1 hypothetical protein HF521_010758 [Silurus meridionalis]